MKTITISLSDDAYSVLEGVAVDPAAWAVTAVNGRVHERLHELRLLVSGEPDDEFAAGRYAAGVAGGQFLSARQVQEEIEAKNALLAQELLLPD